MSDATLTLNARQTYQKIDGFGVNINPVDNWREGQLAPVLDKLIDDLGATIFRFDPYGFTDWIDSTGHAGRAALHTEVFARVYRDQPFRDAWAMARYLTNRGAQLILNVSGIVPGWMCAEDSKTLADLEAYADLLTSLAVWARHEEKITFNLFGPFNETDLGPPEGPYIAPDKVVRVLELLIERFDAAGLSDIKFVAADQAYYSLEYLRSMAAGQRLREKVAVAGLHCYSDIPLYEVRDFIAENNLTHWHYWLTEYGDLDQTGEHEWEVAVSSTRRLLSGINDGVQAALVWDAYDNMHGHDASWSIYGLLRKGVKAYTPKKRYYAAKHIYRFIPPGSIRIASNCDESSMSSAAFLTPNGDLTLVGLNEGAPLRLDVIIDAALLMKKQFRFFITNRHENCSLSYAFPVSEKICLTVPGESIFTLTTLEYE